MKFYLNLSSTHKIKTNLKKNKSPDKATKSLTTQKKLLKNTQKTGKKNVQKIPSDAGII